MIFYATVHWKSDRWIDVQREMIVRYTDKSFKTYAFCTGIASGHLKSFDVVIDQGDPPHETKLDMLAKKIIEDGASDDDWIIFIDGDAFPIAPVYISLEEYVQSHELVAVKRVENLGEQQPHPCFCITTVGLWKRIKGTWQKGYKWMTTAGFEMTDVGGDLLRQLEIHQIDWWPLLRSNTLNRNPVFFGIYGNIVYHHGAGFRALGCPQIYADAGVFDIYKRIDARILNNLFTVKWQKRVRKMWIHPEARAKRRIHNALLPLETEIYQQINANPEYVRVFIR